MHPLDQPYYYQKSNGEVVMHQPANNIQPYIQYQSQFKGIVQDIQDQKVLTNNQPLEQSVVRQMPQVVV